VQSCFGLTMFLNHMPWMSNEPLPCVESQPLRRQSVPTRILGGEQDTSAINEMDVLVNAAVFFAGNRCPPLRLPERLSGAQPRRSFHGVIGPQDAGASIALPQ
jgi:hypothetical protein